MTSLVAIFGGLGAACRFLADTALSTRGYRRLPTSTLIINAVGSFLLGCLLGCSPALDSLTIRILGVGFLGGFTTFSTASVELVRLAGTNRTVAAVFLATTMFLISAIAAIAGLWLGSLFISGLLVPHS